MVETTIPTTFTTTTLIASTPPYHNPDHHLYLHHSDHPGIRLASHPLIRDNYQTWSRAINMALSVKNKLGFINGTITVPGDSSKDFPQ